MNIIDVLSIIPYFISVVVGETNTSEQGKGSFDNVRRIVQVEYILKENWKLLFRCRQERKSNNYNKHNSNEKAGDGQSWNTVRRIMQVLRGHPITALPANDFMQMESYSKANGKKGKLINMCALLYVRVAPQNSVMLFPIR